MLEGKTVNLRVMEKEDIPLFVEWLNSLDVISGDYDFLPQISRAEMEKESEKPSDPLYKSFIIEKKDGSKIGSISHSQPNCVEYHKVSFPAPNKASIASLPEGII